MVYCDVWKAIDLTEVDHEALYNSNKDKQKGERPWLRDDESKKSGINFINHSSKSITGELNGSNISVTNDEGNVGMLRNNRTGIRNDGSRNCRSNQQKPQEHCECRSANIYFTEK